MDLEEADGDTESLSSSFLISSESPSTGVDVDNLSSWKGELSLLELFLSSQQSRTATNTSMLNVHLVPHTHDDVGWLKTVDQYYYGDRNNIQHAGVQYILDSVIDQLQQDPARRFIYVETAFFYRWWKQQSQNTRRIVTQLVNEGRLEFINGGWCMSDEATTHYSAVIDQMTLGLQFLNETFGECGRPRVAWHIDPFGHAREHASIFAQMGYDGFFFGRLDYQDKARRMKTKEMEMLWRASESLTLPLADLFTGVLPNGYNPPEGFCWDQSCNDAPIRDDPDLEDYNVDEIVQRFLNVSYNQFSQSYIKLIKVNVLYSTPSCYLQELNLANLTWPLKTDDFFPYADDAHDFWTGYFTSRPALKLYERLSNSRLQTCNQLEVLSGPKSTSGPFGEGDSDTMKRAMGVAQHHDAVSGTEKQHVAYDYARRLATGWAHCEVLVRNSLAVLSGSESPRVFCENLNISVCPLTESSQKFSMNVYNPLGRTVSWPVRLPVNGSLYSVTDTNGKAVNSQVGNYVCMSFKLICNIYDMKSSSLLPLLSVSINNKSVLMYVFKFLKVTFDDTTGLLSSLTNLETNQTIRLTQNFYWYNASAGNNKESRQPSGAYIFRPNSSDPFVINKTAEIQIVTVSSTVQEVTQWFSPWVSQVVRLYEGHSELELEWTVGPVPIADGLGKEVITRLDTDIESSDYFYTDSNGREVLERRKDYRPTWDLKQTEPIAGNYYPINSRAYIKDDKHQLTVVTDRSQGASSIYNGSLEIMLHRRLLYDDFRGVGEPLSEPGEFFDGLVARGRLLLTLTPPNMAADVHRPLAQGMVLQPLLSFQDGTPLANTKLEFTGLQDALPPAVHLLTLSQWDKDSVLIRLEHQYQAEESKTHSQPVTVNLQKLFSTLEVLGASEMSLGANQWKEDMNRLQWNTGSQFFISLTFEQIITLNPMEIRTFLLQVRQL
uniref:Alpha-mannosidase n=1 Tax=Sinocyclocheilus anshuiensis TaxID=1608454 RepID=A0A671T5G0_9TELE